MAFAAAYHPNDGYKRPFSYSLLLHGALAGLVAFGMLNTHRGDSWGGPGGSITVGLVGNVPAIPLPHPDVETTSRTVEQYPQGATPGGASQDRASSYRCLAHSEIQGLEAAEDSAQADAAHAESSAATQRDRHASFEDSRKSHAASAQCRSVWARRFAGHSHVVVRHGTRNHTRRAGLQWRRWRRFRLAVLLVRGGGAAPHQQQLLAKQSTIDPNVAAAPRKVCW